jgi:hypothetical protein
VDYGEMLVTIIKGEGFILTAEIYLAIRAGFSK